MSEPSNLEAIRILQHLIDVLKSHPELEDKYSKLLKENEKLKVKLAKMKKEMESEDSV